MTAGPYHDESDSASFSDELSPTDGYFSRHKHPQENTASSSNASASKAREAEAENTMSRPSRSLYSRRTLLSSVDPDETTPLIDASQPPPTYPDDTANQYQGYTAEQNEGSRVGVVGNGSGLLIFTTRRSPQNMGNTPVPIRDTMEIRITTALEGGFVTAVPAAGSSRSLWPFAPLQLQFGLWQQLLTGTVLKKY